MSGSFSLHHLLNPEPHPRQSPPSSHLRVPPLAISDSEEDSDDFFAPEDSEDDENDTNMPVATRNTTHRHSVVDLTDTPDRPDSMPPPPPRRKRSTTEEGPAKKRGRISREDAEECNLTEENPSVEEELRQAQQQATIRAQQAEVDAGPQKLGSLQCIICMDSYTNATATACGHFYCHECLHHSLLVGERADERKGTCPVCRKTISRKKKHDIIPVSFMTRETFVKQKKQKA